MCYGSAAKIRLIGAGLTEVWRKLGAEPEWAISDQHDVIKAALTIADVPAEAHDESAIARGRFDAAVTAAAVAAPSDQGAGNAVLIGP